MKNEQHNGSEQSGLPPFYRRLNRKIEAVILGFDNKMHDILKRLPASKERLVEKKLNNTIFNYIFTMKGKSALILGFPQDEITKKQMATKAEKDATQSFQSSFRDKFELLPEEKKPPMLKSFLRYGIIKIKTMPDKYAFIADGLIIQLLWVVNTFISESNDRQKLGNMINKKNWNDILNYCADYSTSTPTQQSIT